MFAVVRHRINMIYLTTASLLQPFHYLHKHSQEETTTILQLRSKYTNCITYTCTQQKMYKACIHAHRLSTLSINRQPAHTPSNIIRCHSSIKPASSIHPSSLRQTHRFLTSQYRICQFCRNFLSVWSARNLLLTLTHMVSFRSINLTIGLHTRQRQHLLRCPRR